MYLLGGYNPTHWVLGSLLLETQQVFLCVCISGGPRASSQTAGRSHVASRCLVTPQAAPRCSPRTPRMPSCEGAAVPCGEAARVRSGPASQAQGSRAWRGLTRSPVAEPLWPRPQDLALQASLGARWG